MYKCFKHYIERYAAKEARVAYKLKSMSFKDCMEYYDKGEALHSQRHFILARDRKNRNIMIRADVDSARDIMAFGALIQQFLEWGPPDVIYHHYMCATTLFDAHLQALIKYHEDGTLPEPLELTMPKDLPPEEYISRVSDEFVKYYCDFLGPKLKPPKELPADDCPIYRCYCINYVGFA